MGEDKKFLIKAGEYKKFLVKYVGLELVNVKGSHYYYNYPKNDKGLKLVPKICVATHSDGENIPKAFLDKDFKYLNITWDEVKSYFKKK
jgi:predicted RNA binding protein YcfA (HicA-like mRNA interferase family)